MTPADIAKSLTAAQRKVVLWLPTSGFIVGGLRAMGRAEPSRKAYLGLKSAGLLAEHWTWASTTRPDTGLSELGLLVRAELERDELNRRAKRPEGEGL